MFWRFGYHPASTMDALLDKDGVTLDELFEEEELLQECKSHNSKLVEFLCRPDILQQLLNMVIVDHFADDKDKSARYSYLASEIFSCDIFALSNAAIAQPGLLQSFWKLLDEPAPIEPHKASHFSKVNGILMQKKTGEMVEFVKSQPDSLSSILKHVGNSSIAELLLKIISLEEIPEGHGIVAWLSEQKLIPSLVERLNPNEGIETHNTAAQTLLDIIAVSYQNAGPMDQEEGFPISLGGGNSLVDELKSEAMMRKIFDYMLDQTAPNATSSLSSGVIIMIELIRRYCSEIEQAEFQQHQFQTQLLQSRGQEFGILPTPEKMKSLAVDLNELLKVIGEKVGDFTHLLEHPRNMKQANTTLGKSVPLGSERLRTCELFAEILHLQYLYFSSPLFERLVFGDAPEEDDDDSMMEGKEGGGVGEDGKDVDALSTGMDGMKLKPSAVRNVADELSGISELLVASNVLPMCLVLFYEFPWNNFLHSVVYDMIAKVFNTYSFTSQSSNFAHVGPDGNEILPAEDGSMTPLEEKMKQVSSVFKKLVISILVEGKLTTRITGAQRRNDTEASQAKGVRLGYMGHLTYISDEVTKLVEKCLEDFGPDVIDLISSEEWQTYLNGVLRETKDRDRQALGGVRPTNTQAASTFGKIDEADIVPLNPAPPPKNAGSSAATSIGGTMSARNEVDEDDEGMGNVSDFAPVLKEDTLERHLPSLRLALIIPFTHSESARVLNNLATSWTTHPPCDPTTHASYHVLTDLVFYYHKDILHYAPHLIKQLQTSVQKSPYHACFASIRFVNALLTDEEDVYPLGASKMFFHLFRTLSTGPLLRDHHSRTSASHHHQAFYYMEPDNTPCRRNWLDRIYEESAIPGDFWMRGSILRDRNPRVGDWSFSDHLNGNALYRADDARFIEFVLRVEKEMEMDEGGRLYLNSYDIALDLVRRNRSLVEWVDYAEMAAKFQFTETVQNWYRTPVNATLLCLENPATYLVHGREVFL
ncbi:hypothetical protein HDU98_007368 [Podochytrium sp. JEL0797]|nr:hypothetical protein HDU98_007368 [Podochytrium sp. JEL0797]